MLVGMTAIKSDGADFKLTVRLQDGSEHIVDELGIGLTSINLKDYDEAAQIEWLKMEA
jgi:hypothetical protein